MDPVSGTLEFTGERFVPGVRGEIWVEHWHRYHFAARFAAGKRVVDAACGEGYGSALLARTAASVTGADISPAAIAHARAAYAGVVNLAFVEAPCAKLPLEDGSADLFVSFETVEHIAEQEDFVAEIARVLAPDGLLLLSCPNKREYSDRRGFENEFHVKELYREELEALVSRRFKYLRWHGQRPSFFSVIAPEPRAETGHLVEVSEAMPAQAAPALAEPLYFLVAASRSAATLGMLPAMLSVLSDRDDWAHRDYEKVMGDLGVAGGQLETLAKQAVELAAAREEAMKSRDEALAWAGQLESRLAQAERTVSEQSRAIAERDGEIARRGGLSWWLRLPFRRLFGR
ncbi:MAG TPA: methyltransferase domain-containing protein [Usitatibacteraceae bacterium]|nr:methyltransferase domain-containing protein [Usitatibacteraceae bacterium]